MTGVELAAATGAISEISGGSDFSLISLLFEADIVVQFVMLVLVIASIWSWAIIIEKWFALASVRKKSAQYEEAFWSGRLDEVEARPGVGTDPAARVFSSISREWNDARRGVASESEARAMVERAERSMRAAVDREMNNQSGGIGVLATVASASPFIGLFGTVWGIMNAFLKIGEAGDASLVTTAGPIAEALFATGLGLVAAIPATIFYNKFSTDLNRLADQLDTFAQDVLVRLSRRGSETAGR
ncbi:MAG: MotA/TolQ/ExbB proton channel family protein [Pseudomonadota bacterium]